MEENRRAELSRAGVNLETALERFMGNEELLMACLTKLSQDVNYGLFKAAMEEKRYEDAFKAAHSLKGMCGNLSLDSLYEAMSKEVEFLRAGMHSEAEAFFPEVARKFEETVEILEAL